ncbi:hypothetical protein CMEL01_09338 [Colletotrichum melonis]|uniref:Uncharacterized protein n=1 Tax=Colletotrichum melonis TaxID=1209925 RepID=A0AAI9U0T1_9PEZI|nr:hypothetical protein CMEL01_09338 [Colletotrichum melonis]
MNPPKLSRFRSPLGPTPRPDPTSSTLASHGLINGFFFFTLIPCPEKPHQPFLA